MRLLNASTLTFEDFLGDWVPKYAILSHRWIDNEEVTFQDMNNGTADTKLGFEKLKLCAKQAALDHLSHFWIDTCCIDKSSSADLSEAINSMYQWYRDATVCYVYLSDVSINAGPDAAFPETVSTFRDSVWFLRGWTLQELLAPSNLVFYSCEWKVLGKKAELIVFLEEITGINRHALNGGDLNTFSIAQKLSWAAKRKTTRIEDTAYSLLGLFDVNMPLLYGEGKKAFIRLQQEILKISHDHSIFAWTSDEPATELYVGLLAPSPAAFLRSSEMRPLGMWSDSGPSDMTSRGLQARLFMLSDGRGKGAYLARLECIMQNGRKPTIALQLVASLDYGDQYVRIGADTLGTQSLDFSRRGSYKTIFVRQNVGSLFSPPRPMLGSHTLADQHLDLFWVRSTPDFEYSCEPASAWKGTGRYICLSPGDIGRLRLSHRFGSEDAILIQFTLSFGTLDGSLTMGFGSPKTFSDVASIRTRFGFSSCVSCFLRRDNHGHSVIGTATATTTTIDARLVRIITLYVRTIED